MTAMRDGHTLNGVGRWGWFYLFWVDDAPDAVTFGITRDPERRLINYHLSGIHMVGVWKFPTYSDAEAYETNVKYRLTHGDLSGVIVGSAGRWTESCDPLCGQTIEDELDSWDEVHRMTDRHNGPWHNVTIATYLHNHRRKGKGGWVPRTTPISRTVVHAMALASVERPDLYPVRLVDELARTVIDGTVEELVEMIRAAVLVHGQWALEVCQQVIDYYEVEILL